MLDPATAPLLLVGHRTGLKPALRAIGRPVFLLLSRGKDLPAGAHAFAGVREVDMHGPEEPIVAAARDLLEGEPPAAVVALAERTVLVAARLRESFGLRGNDVEVALHCADKVEMKRCMDAAGVPVAPWRELDRDASADELVDQLGLPLVLKPRRDSGGRGQHRLEERASVARTLAKLRAGGAFDEGYGWLAEGWLDGVEMSVESFVRRGTPVFQNPTEYYVPRHANILPAGLAAEEWADVRAFSTRALAAAGVERGVTHLELFRTARGLVLGELAVRPPGGRLMQLLQHAWGFDPWEALLRLELDEEVPFPREPLRTAGVWVLHPGAGTVEAVEGLEEARSLPRVRRISLKIEAGQSIPERIGTGQDIGSIHVDGPDRDAVASALSQARETLRIAVRSREA